jgi:hypothetical protein
MKKIKCVETESKKSLPEAREWGVRECFSHTRGIKFKHDLIHCKNLCKCHKVSPPRTTIKGKKVSEVMGMLICTIQSLHHIYIYHSILGTP